MFPHIWYYNAIFMHAKRFALVYTVVHFSLLTGNIQASEKDTEFPHSSKKKNTGCILKMSPYIHSYIHTYTHTYSERAHSLLVKKNL